MVRDIKSANMLLKTEDGSEVSDWATVNVGGLILKISDFGLCRQLNESKASQSITNTVVGTASWMAPEVKRAMYIDDLKRAPYSKYSDIWSCGLVAYNMARGEVPGNPYNF